MHPGLDGDHLVPDDDRLVSDDDYLSQMMTVWFQMMTVWSRIVAFRTRKGTRKPNFKGEKLWRR